MTLMNLEWAELSLQALTIWNSIGYMFVGHSIQKQSVKEIADISVMQLVEIYIFFVSLLVVCLMIEKCITIF